MGEEEKNPNRIYLIPELVEEIFLRLPLKSILKFKTVSKYWRSVLESRRFTERRMKIQKKRKILAAGDGDGDRTESLFKGDAEMDMFYLHCEEATRPSLTCDGLVCIPVPGWVNVLNPSTGEFLRFPSGPDPVTKRYNYFGKDHWWINFPAYWVMGFGKDKVNGRYKIVRMFFNPNHFCEILDVEIGEWRKLTTPPPYKVEARRRSACVNGSIYWLEFVHSYSLLALDLYTEEFRNVSLPPAVAMSDQVVNLEDRVAIVRSDWRGDWKLEILILDEQEENWRMTYSMNLMHFAYPVPNEKVLFKPLAVSKKGNIFFCDNKKRLFKFYPETNSVHCIAQDTCVISPFTENLVTLRPSSVPEACGYRSGLHYLEQEQEQEQEQARGSPTSKSFKLIELRIPNILLTTTLVSLVIFRCFLVSSRS